MYAVRIALLGLALSGSMAPATAQAVLPGAIERPPPAQCDDVSAARRPCAGTADAAPVAPPRRRAVPLTIERMPPSIPPPAYRAAPPPPSVVPAASAPVPLSGCGGGVCRDAPPSWSAWRGRGVSRDDQTLVFAEVTHRSWISAIQAFLAGERELAPPMESTGCQLGRCWRPRASSATASMRPSRRCSSGMSRSMAWGTN